MSLLVCKIHYKFYRFFCFVGIHLFVVLYNQPKLKTDNILILECKCGKQKQVNGINFLKKEAKKRRVYLIKS
jgi:hypothetical protein